MESERPNYRNIVSQSHWERPCHYSPKPLI